MMTRSATPLAARGGRGEASSEGRKKGKPCTSKGRKRGSQARRARENGPEEERREERKERKQGIKTAGIRGKVN